jgi:group I intron endonuclease
MNSEDIIKETKQPIIGVYKISNLVSDRYYIGYSKNINKRFYVHRCKLKNSCHDNIFLQRAYNLDGEDKFIYEIIHRCNTEKEAKEIELQYLTDLSIRDKLYNLNYNNSGGDLLTNHPDKESIREKIIKSYTETISKMSCEERKEKYGKIGEKNGMYGKTHTEEARKILSEIKKNKNTGEENSFFGKHHTKETKQKFSEIAKQRIGEKNPFFGKHHTEETKEKLREKIKGTQSPSRISISIDNINYVSMTDASKKLSIPLPTILWRLNSKNPKFNNYKYSELSTQPF